MNRHGHVKKSKGRRKQQQMDRLLRVVHDLRTRCPWDKKQTHRSLIPYLIEEAYEAVQAIEEGSKTALKEELGDVLLQVVLHAEIAREKGDFTFEEVAQAISEKMIERHPHVYKNVQVKGVKDLLKNWSRLKKEEKPDLSLLAGIPKALPGLHLAQRYGEIAASVGFDWPNTVGVFDKLKEELAELESEMKRKRRVQRDIEMEMGDVLFVLTRLAAHLKLDAERALKQSCDKFATRFHALETAVAKKGKKLTDCKLEEMESIWQHIKRNTHDGASV